MECAKVRDERELYAAGGCLPERREEIRRHIDECPPCAAELAEAERFVNMLDRDIKHVAPSVEQRPVVRRFPIPKWGWALLRGAAACVVVALLLYYLMSRESAPEAWAGPRLTARVTGPSELNLKWSHEGSNVRGYIVERSMDEKNYSEISRVGGGVTTFVDGGLATGTTYYYRVLTETESGASNVSNVASVRIGPLNMSTRGYVGTDDDRLIAGIIIGGDQARKIMIRTWGPTLIKQGLSRILKDPMITLYAGQRIIAQNNDWHLHDPLGEQLGYRCGTPDEIRQKGLALKGAGADRESAIIITLPPGSYTAVVGGADGGTGIGIVEVFEVE